MKTRNINSNGTMQVLTYGGNVLTSKVGLLLYSDMSICLKRKYNMWKEFYDQYSSR